MNTEDKQLGSAKIAHLLETAIDLSACYPLLTIGSDPDSPLWDIIHQVEEADTGSYIYLCFCCADCDGGYGWDLLIRDIRTGLERIKDIQCKKQ